MSNSKERRKAARAEKFGPPGSHRSAEASTTEQNTRQPSQEPKTRTTEASIQRSDTAASLAPREKK